MASDAVAVLVEMGLVVEVEEVERRAMLWTGEDRAEVVAFLRRQLCVGPERDAEIDALLGPSSRPRPPRRHGLVGHRRVRALLAC